MKARRKPLSRSIYITILTGGIALFLMAGVVVLLMFPYTILSGIKSDTNSIMRYTQSLVDKAYLADLYKRTKEIYNSLPGDIQSDPFTDEFKDNFRPLADEEGFLAIREILDKCRQEHNIGTIAFGFFDEEHERIVFVVDGDRREYMYIPGQWISDDNGSIDSLRTIRKIKASDWFMSLNYGRLSGWTVTNYTDVTDDSGNVIGIAYTDMDVNGIIKKIRIFTIIYLVLMLLVIFMMMDRLSQFLRKRVIIPIGALSKTAVQYTARDKTVPEGPDVFFKKLDIRTGDEIEDLWKSLVNMEDDISETMERIRSMTSQQERLDTELAIANQIQSNILPREFPPFPDRKEFSLFARMVPAKEVAGDFYDFFLMDDDHIALVIADVSDKGIPAALFMMTARTLIKNGAGSQSSPEEILSYANSRLCEGNEAALFVTVWMAVIEISTGRGLASNAGHMHPALSSEGGGYRLVEYEHSLPLGITEKAGITQHEFSLHPGDRLFVYTDGVMEAMDASEEQFGTKRLLDALNQSMAGTPEDTVKSVMDSIGEFTSGCERADDITMLCFYYNYHL